HRSDRPRKAAPIESRSGTRAQPRWGETPIFAQLASVWFRDDLQGVDAVRGAGGTKWPTGNWDALDLFRPIPAAVPAGLTASGLPKRKPRSQLIPRGRATPTAQATHGPHIRRPRDVQALLTSYQEGLRQGRAGCERR